MPFINLKVAGPTLAPEQIAKLQQRITELMAVVLKKNPDLTSVLVEQVPPQGWSVGGKAIKTAAHLDATITAGTNDAEQKTRFITDANALLHDVLGGDLPVATYVVIDELPADSWGYDGLTQRHRQAAVRPG